MPKCVKTNETVNSLMATYQITHVIILQWWIKKSMKMLTISKLLTTFGRKTNAIENYKKKTEHSNSYTTILNWGQNKKVTSSSYKPFCNMYFLCKCFQCFTFFFSIKNNSNYLLSLWCLVSRFLKKNVHWYFACSSTTQTEKAHE